jgi:hypothetical protein
MIYDHVMDSFAADYGDHGTNEIDALTAND